MHRRSFLAAFVGAIATPSVGNAQPAGKVYRVGVLSVAASHTPIDVVFESAMKNLGYMEGRNLILERRYTSGRQEQFVSAAEDFVRLNVDTIVVWTPAATAAVKNATKTIPIVFLAGGAAVESGLVSGLPRPRENVTGITFQANRTLAPKYLEMLKDLIPRLRSVAVLRAPADDPPDETELYEDAARALGIRLRQVALYRPADFQDALLEIERSQPQALLGPRADCCTYSARRWPTSQRSDECRPFMVSAK